MSKLFVSEHPLIHTKMAMLRNKETGTKEFREIIGEVASLLFYEATKIAKTILNLQSGDQIIITAGPTNKAGATNLLKVSTI